MINQGVNQDKLNKIWSYDTVAKLLHWIVAVLLIGMVALGWYMMSIENDPGSEWYFDLHKSFGIVVATLVLFRLLWRFSHKPAPLPQMVPLWQAKLARGIHYLLYVCIIVMPLSGFLGESFGKYGIAFFGWPLPKWFNANQAISGMLFQIHNITVWVLVALVSLHVLAALKHFFINKDGVFQRMWFSIS